MAHAQKPDFVFRRNGRVHLNRRGASVQSTTGSRGVRISGSNAGYTTFRGSVKGIGYPLHSPVSLSLPLPCVAVCHHISTGVYEQLHLKFLCNLVRYWLQAPWGWHDSVETCRSVIICEIIVNLLVIVQNNKICPVQVLKKMEWINFCQKIIRHVWNTHPYTNWMTRRYSKQCDYNNEAAEKSIYKRCLCKRTIQKFCSYRTVNSLLIKTERLLRYLQV